MENKTEILKRLIKEDKITIDELLILAEKEKEYIYTPYYATPWYAPSIYPTVTYGDGTLHQQL